MKRIRDVHRSKQRLPKIIRVASLDAAGAAFRRLTRKILDAPLLRLLQLQGRAFDPAVVNVMVTAFDNTLRELKISSRHDPLVERVAQIIIECAEKGMRDVAEMRDCALKAIRNDDL